ncbi:MAG: CoA-transferase [Thermocladium sp.]
MRNERPIDNVINCMSRAIDNESLVYVGLSSALPLLAVALAKARGLRLKLLSVSEIYDAEDISITPSSGDPFAFHGGKGILTSLEAFDLARKGLLDIMFFSAAQVDAQANLNISVIGSWEKPRVRLPGGAAAAYLYVHSRKLILWLNEHSKRSLPAKVDFITAPGPSSDEKRRIVLCTPKAYMEYDQSISEWVLKSLIRGTDLNDVLSNMGFAPHMDSLTYMDPLNEEELSLLNRIDPNNVRYK